LHPRKAVLGVIVLMMFVIITPRLSYEKNVDYGGANARIQQGSENNSQRTMNIMQCLTPRG
jgi:hypothetical protein